MVFEKKQLSRMVAILMVVACAVAFMPLLSGQAFAASKKTAKPKGLKVTQAQTTETAGEYVVTAKWKKAKKTTYKVVVKDSTGAKVASKGKKGKTTFAGKVGEKYTVNVKAKAKGKKWSKWAKKSLTVKDYRAALEKVAVKADAPVMRPGTVMTASVEPAAAAADVEYQWYTISATGLEVPVAGATKSTYEVQKTDVDSYLKVVATAAATSVSYVGSVDYTTATPVEKESGASAKGSTDQAYVGETVSVITTMPAGATATFAWYVGGVLDYKATGASYTPTADDLNKTLVCKVSIKDADGKELLSTKEQTIDFGTVKNNVASKYAVKFYQGTKEVTAIAAGESVTAKVVDADGKVISATPSFAWSWTYNTIDARGNVTENKGSTTGAVLNTSRNGNGYTACGTTVALKATVSSGDYVGDLSASIAVGSDEAASIDFVPSGKTTAAVGEKLTVKVAGAVTPDMTTSADIAWKAYDPAHDTTTTLKEAAKGQKSYTVGKADVGLQIYATAAKSDGSVVATPTKAVVGKALLGFDGKEIAGSEDGEDVVQEGAGIYVILDNEAVEASDYTIGYYESANGTSWAEKASATAPTVVAGNYYKVELKLTADGAKAFKLDAPDTATKIESVVVRAAKKQGPAPEVKLQVKGAADPDTKYVDVTADTEIVAESVLKASVTGLTAGTKCTFTWYEDTDKNAAVQTTTNVAAVEDVWSDTFNKQKAGHKYFVKVAPVDYNTGTSITTAKVVAANPATLTGNLTAPVVGGTFNVVNAPTDATITWYLNDDVIEAAQDKASYTATADAYGKVIKVKVEAKGYATYEAKTTDKVAASSASKSIVAKIDGFDIENKYYESGELTIVPTPADAVASYKWYRSTGEGTDVEIGADAPYTLSDADKVDDSFIYCYATYKAAYGGGNATVATVEYDKDKKAWTKATVTPPTPEKQYVAVDPSEYYTYEEITEDALLHTYDAIDLRQGNSGNHPYRTVFPRLTSSDASSNFDTYKATGRLYRDRDSSLEPVSSSATYYSYYNYCLMVETFPAPDTWYRTGMGGYVKNTDTTIQKSNTRYYLQNMNTIGNDGETWYVKDGDSYKAAASGTIDPDVTYYHYLNTANPAANNWFELVNGVYVGTEDTSVVEGKTYYEYK